VDNPSKKKQRVDSPEVKAKVSAIKNLIKWSPTEVIDHESNLLRKMIAALLHLSETYGPKVDEVGFVSPDSRPIALRDFAAKELKLFPYSKVASTEPPWKGGTYIEIKATVGNCQEQTLYLVAPDVVANPTAKGVKTITPFWNATRNDENEPSKLIQLECPSQLFTTTLPVEPRQKGKNDDFKIAAKGPPKVVFLVPYLTNSIAVQRGHAVASSAGNAILTKIEPPSDAD
jgi:hypothetical protein